jgi:hypothetical protein
MTFNTELAQQVMSQIKAYPESHVQATWRCGTGFCFAGWVAEIQRVEWVNSHSRMAGGEFVVVDKDSSRVRTTSAGDYFGPQRLADRPVITSRGRELEADDVIQHVSDYAQEELGLGARDAGFFFSGTNSRTRLELLVKAYSNGDPEEIQAAINHTMPYDEYLAERTPHPGDPI